MSEARQQKDELREIARRRRAEIRDTEHERAANDRLLEHVLSFEPRSVSAYMPIRTELSPVPSMTRLVEVGVHVCLPVVLGAGRPLEFREWTPGSVLVEGAFGARVPETGERLDPDVVITPLLAFDRRGYRLGYGGGYYDRTFAALHPQGRGLGVGIAYAGQRVDRIPNERDDVALHSIVTEVGVELFGGQ